MATRLYLPSVNGSNPVTPPSLFGGWDKQASFKYHLTPNKLSTAMTERTQTSTALSPEYMCHGQWISDPLDPQTISGTIKGQVRARQNNTGMNCTLAMFVGVISNDGQTLRATLVARTGGQDFSTTPPEFSTSGSTARNRAFRDASEALNIPITSYTCVKGDRLVFEPGSIDRTTSTSQIAALVFGDNAVGDLAEGDTDTSTADNPWIEFSNTIVWESAFSPNPMSWMPELPELSELSRPVIRSPY